MLDNLIEKAKSLNLAHSKEWKDLLHIDKKTSEIISPYFFITPLPSKNLAQDELEATIRAFYQPIESVQIPQAFYNYNAHLLDLMKEVKRFVCLCQFQGQKVR